MYKTNKYYKRGWHERRKGYSIDMCPFMELQYHKYNEWIDGWKDADSLIVNGEMDEYD